MDTYGCLCTSTCCRVSARVRGRSRRRTNRTQIGHLKRGVAEFAPLEAVILSPGCPVLSGNSEAVAVITRQKTRAGGDRYIFACNHDGVSHKVTLTLSALAISVSVVGGENRFVTVDSISNSSARASSARLMATL